MIEKATDPQLRPGSSSIFAKPRDRSGGWNRCSKCTADTQAVTCPAIDGIIKEANEVAGEVADKRVLDAALIAAAAGGRTL